MKIAFMGTSEFAVPTLDKIIDSEHELAAVITQPDRPKGRGNKFIPSPVKELALSHDLNVYQPLRIKGEEAIAHIRSWDIDLIVVVSYGQIIPPEILDYPPLGCINVHASLLPRYRGAAPIQRAIMAGEKISGITTMLMDKGLDTGDIILQLEVPIDQDMNHGEYEQVLARAGADLLLATLAEIESGDFPRRQQDSSLATYAHMLSRADEEIKWQNEASVIYNQIRALSPKPAAYTSFLGKNIKVFSSRIIAGSTSGGEIGQIVDINPNGILVQTGRALLEIGEVQLEGKKRMACSDFLKGFRLVSGDLLGS